MNAHTKITAGNQDGTIDEIDALIRNLQNWRHWAATKADRAPMRAGTEKQRRLYLTADRIEQEARRDSLGAAYTLFQVDGLHDDFLAACSDTGFDPEQSIVDVISVGRGIAA